MNERIEFVDHALKQAVLRGATLDEVRDAIRTGEEVPAKKNRTGHRKTFHYGELWRGVYYENKQVLAIVVREAGTVIVITVYAFYF